MRLVLNNHAGANLLCLVIVAAVLAPSPGQAAPSLVGYSGRVYDSGGAPLPNGTVAMSFKIYDNPIAASTLLFEEEHAAVALSSGYFQVLLNEHAQDPGFDLIFAGDELRWLEIVVAGDTLSPRQALAPVPWALGGGGGLALAGSGSATTAARSDHDHVGQYSAVDHDHDSRYAAASHDHASTYAPVSHTHSYLPLSGGTVTGATTFSSSMAVSGSASLSGGASTSNLAVSGDITITDGSARSLKSTTYWKKSSVYMVEVSSGGGCNTNSNCELSARCDDENDLLITGGCYINTISTQNLSLQRSFPFYVNTSDEQATWFCKYRNDSGSGGFNVVAYAYCIAIP